MVQRIKSLINTDRKTYDRVKGILNNFKLDFNEKISAF